MPEPGRRGDFLAAVARQLQLDPDTEADVLDELDAHLDDSIRALVGAGRSSVEAEREALRRLGDPATLARRIRRAHQTRRRLLAAVGGGLLGAADGAARAVVPVIAVLYPAVLAAALLLTGFSEIAGLPDALTSDDVAGGAFLAAAPIGFAGARRMTWALARGAHWTLGRAALLTGLAGAILVGCWSLLGPDLAMTWGIALGEVVLAAGWLVGAASVGRLADLRLTWRRWFAITTIGAVLVALPGLFTLRPSHAGHSGSLFEPDLARVGVVLPGAELPENRGHSPNGVSTELAVRLVRPYDSPAGTPVLPAGATDPRLELWPALPLGPRWPDWPEDRVGALDPSATTPLRTSALTPSGTTYVGAIAYGDIRGLDEAWVLGTAMIDGRRSVLLVEPVLPEFRGNLTDWIASWLPGATNAYPSATR